MANEVVDDQGGIGAAEQTLQRRSVELLQDAVEVVVHPPHPLPEKTQAPDAMHSTDDNNDDRVATTAATTMTTGVPVLTIPTHPTPAASLPTSSMPTMMMTRTPTQLPYPMPPMPPIPSPDAISPYRSSNRPRQASVSTHKSTGAVSLTPSKISRLAMEPTPSYSLISYDLKELMNATTVAVREENVPPPQYHEKSMDWIRRARRAARREAEARAAESTGPTCAPLLGAPCGVRLRVWALVFTAWNIMQDLAATFLATTQFDSAIDGTYIGVLVVSMALIAIDTAGVTAVLSKKVAQVGCYTVFSLRCVLWNVVSGVMVLFPSMRNGRVSSILVVLALFQTLGWLFLWSYYAEIRNRLRSRRLRRRYSGSLALDVEDVIAHGGDMIGGRRGSDVTVSTVASGIIVDASATTVSALGDDTASIRETPTMTDVTMSWRDSALTGTPSTEPASTPDMIDDPSPQPPQPSTQQTST